MFNLDQHLREEAVHLLAMRQTPGFRDHAELRLKQLKESDPMYLALDGLIRELRSSQPFPSAPAAGSTTVSTGQPRPGASSASAKP